MGTEALSRRKFEVLFIEDNPADVELIRGALERSKNQVRVTVAPTGGSALEFLRSKGPHRALFPFDFILLDLGLPDKSGWEVLSALKGDPLLKDIPVLILTGSEDHHVMMKAQFSPADDCLQKPFGLSQLGALIGYLEENWFKKTE